MSKANDRWKAFYKLPKNSIDVLFMGNSHVNYSFQPKIINDIIPINSFIVGIDAENIVISYYELREVLKTQKPKLIVLETFALDLDDKIKQGFLFQFLDAGFWDQNRTAIATRYLSLSTLYNIFPSLRSRIDWEKPASFFNPLFAQFAFSKQRELSNQQGSTPYNKVILENTYLTLSDLPTAKIKKPRPDNLIYLEKFYDLCKENNILLIFTTAPIKKITEDLFSRYSPFDTDTFAKANNIDWITFTSSKFNHLHFHDPTHINNIGSVITSIDMAQMLSIELNLPINQQKLDYYSSFVFSDYTITHVGNDYEISLLKENGTTFLEYKWMVSEGNKTILETGWQKEGFCHFTLPEKGDYTIEVDIRNPSGDYVLNAVFSITKTD